MTPTDESSQDDMAGGTSESETGELNRRIAAMVEAPGAMVGRYKLLQLIGEGGFGSVFMAEQRTPVVRRVALKIIKLGMDTRQVVARFEAERQALAMMDHPNIARVFDAGATATGRPYFVMELVQGVPITDYCDQQHLSIRERLELFEQVCQAVQHAHGKGIIHRDIKPSNVLVSERDGRAVARVIDFGIAKAVSTRLTDKTLFTEYQGFVGTPAYMSPEQAGAAVDVDTRTDVYSLGVLLYELLTGTTPFESKKLWEAAVGEMQRMIREVDPPAPSTRISQNRETLAGVAASRKTEPRKLGLLVKGDLDWVVMKALEKDRGRRYATANDLGADVLRHMRDELVTATPPGQLYRLGKLVKRNKLAVGAVVAVNAAILVGLGVSSWMFVRERSARASAVVALKVADEARGLAEEQRVAAVAAKAGEEGQRKRAQENYERARSVVDQVTGIAQLKLADRPEVSEIRKEMLESAATMYEKILSMDGDNVVVIREAVNSYLRAAALRNSIGQGSEAEKQLRRTLELVEGVLKKTPDDTDFLESKGQCLVGLGWTLSFATGDFQGGIEKVEQAREVFGTLCRKDPASGVYHDARIGSIRALAEGYRMSGQIEECETMARLALSELKAQLPKNTRFAGQLHDYEQLMGAALISTGKFAEAAEHLQVALSIRRGFMKADPNNDYHYFLLSQTLSYLGGTICRLGKVEEGLAMTREAIALYDVPIKRHPQYVHQMRAQGYTYEGLGALLLELGRDAEAREAFLEAKRVAAVVYARNPEEVACVREYLPILTICDDVSVCDPTMGVEVGKKLVKLAPRAKVYRQWLAAGQWQAGDAKGAVETLRATKEMEPKGYQWTGHIMALALHALGEDGAAREAFMEAETWTAGNTLRWRVPKRFAVEARKVMGAQ